MRATCSFLLVVAIGIVSAPLNAGDPVDGLVGRLFQHVVVKGESLRSIGARFGVDVSTLAADNGLDVRGPIRVGQALIVDSRHVVPSAAQAGVIIVNVPQRMLFFRTIGRVFSAPVAVGSRNWQTPLASFTVAVKEVNPTWDVPASIAAEAHTMGRSLPKQIPPGPANPLGTHWIGLSIGSLGIHGTNAPSSIYGAVTHGCIRMHPDDIAVLFDLLSVGTPGIIVYDPILLAQDGEEVYLEVHTDPYRRARAPAITEVRTLAAGMGIADRIDWGAVDAVIAARAGVARNVTVR